MSMSYYVTPEQMIRDRAEFAQKGIARGRSLIAAVYQAGVVVVAENPSVSLNKVSEIYDRIAFAGVGKYNEYDRLREGGIRWADQTGFTYSREDVDARALANYYAQHIGDMFTDGAKPLEVEVLVIQLASAQQASKIYHVAFEGTITDEPQFAVIGGESELIRSRVAEQFDPAASFSAQIQHCVTALSGAERTLPVQDLEIACLEDVGERRTFKRLTDAEVSEILAS
jgi:proteasome alpha subunit